MNTKSLSASLHSVASIAPQIIEQDPTNNDTADARILTMQRKMEELQLQIQQKDQLLLHKQHIINNLVTLLNPSPILIILSHPHQSGAHSLRLAPTDTTQFN